MSETAVSPEFLRDFGDRWDRAWNSHDTEQVLALLHPEITWEDTVFWPDVINGIEAMPTYINTIWKVMPDVQFEEVQFFTAAEDGRALYLFKQSGSGPARFGSGHFDSYGCDIFLEFRDGLLARYLAQYEITDMMRQYGALPPRRNLIGGSYLLSLLAASPETTAR
ncbi:nuclear transport factor 2 family protein [Mycolicibacterium sp. P9-22]|uniref:nuclear transport factor 2 family protein n=1 Tax=Mycolicibacterium sp. P9-22 TaxID=2024613 RepID=UPI0011EFE84E|nr:nuclear transport factor 2 family protein [Mycolicibacterium sp. P9-22]KAA0120521.1 nuclear transport factor 2 family protein [Mycolicibacterium sp. P9-22]